MQRQTNRFLRAKCAPANRKTSLLSNNQSFLYLCSQVRDHDELLQNVFGQNIREPSLLDIIWRHVDVIGPEVQIRSGDRSDSPLRLGRERLCLVVGSSGHDDLVSMDVGGARGGSCQLRLFLGLLLDFCYLLPLLWGCWDLHTQDDVTDLGLGQGSYVHTGEEKKNTVLLDQGKVQVVCKTITKAKGVLECTKKIVWWTYLFFLP